MSKSNRLDIAIGILDHTENAIERIKNQHKFEKDLSEFLNTNAYSKDKTWVAGMLNQVSEYCKNEIDTLMENQERIAELEKALELACKELRDNSCMQCNSCNRYEMCDYVLSLYPASYFIEEAKEMMKSE